MRASRKIEAILVVCVVAVIVFMMACGSGSGPSPNPTPTPRPTATPGPTATPTPTPRPSPTPTATPGPTATPTPTPTATPTPTPAGIVVTITNKITQASAGGAAVTLNATVQNDSLSQGVFWTLTASGNNCSPDCGSLSSETTSSVVYTPPATVPTSPNDVPTIQAVSLADGTKFDTNPFPIVESSTTCTSSGYESHVAGHYAFSLTGYNPNGIGVVVGSFTADGAGNITDGQVDANGIFPNGSGNLTPGASHYSVGPDNRGCMTLVTGLGTFVARFSAGTFSGGWATKGRIISWSAPGTYAYIAVGEFERQTTTDFPAGFSGRYAFRSAGTDSGNNRMACAGYLNTTGDAFSDGEEDCNYAGSASHYPEGATDPHITGSYTAFNSQGRGTGTLLVDGNTVHMTQYMVSAWRVFFITSDDSSAGPVVSGEMRKQIGTFTVASFTGRAVVHSAGRGFAMVGVVDGSGASEADNGTIVVMIEGGVDNYNYQSSGTFDYSIATNGRMALDTGGTDQTYFYLYGTNRGFGVTSTGSSGEALEMEPQSNGPFNIGYVTAGNLFVGTGASIGMDDEIQIGALTIDAGNISGAMDRTSRTSQTGNETFSDTFAVGGSSGSVSPVSEGRALGVIISPDKFVMLEGADSDYPSVSVAER